MTRRVRRAVAFRRTRERSIFIRAGSILIRFFGRSLIRFCGRRSSFSCRAPSAARSFWGVVATLGFTGSSSTPRGFRGGRAASSTLRGLKGCRGAAIWGFMGVLGCFCGKQSG